MKIKLGHWGLNTASTQRIAPMMEKHRDIAFDVHQLTDEKCEWVVYPKIGQGTRFSGVSPTAANKKAARLGRIP